MSRGRELSVLEDINLQVREGEFISILGPSGAGKSTLLRILIGLTTPTKGEILYHGIPLSKANPKFSMVFQGFALFLWLTVLENVKIGLYPFKYPDNISTEKAIKMLDLVGLDGFEDAYPKELSGDEADRAIILSHNPGKIEADIFIEIPYERDKNTKEFKYTVDRIFTILTRPKEETPFLLDRERYQFLPHTKVGAIAGLLELVYDKGGRVDISMLALDLSMEVDDIFPLIEASVFLGFGDIKEGDFIISEKGREFSEADIKRYSKKQPSVIYN